MSRRASLYAKQNPTKPRPKVRFSDELVFLDNIKENDIPALGSMLRRASLQVDISGINDAGLTPLHQAVLDGNLMAVRLLVEHGANINKQDDDYWTPLHAACAEGHAEIAQCLKQDIDSGNSYSHSPFTVRVFTINSHSTILYSTGDQEELIRILLDHGADRTILTDEGERPLDLVDPSDFATIRVMLDNNKQEEDSQTSEDDLDDCNS